MVPKEVFSKARQKRGPREVRIIGGKFKGRKLRFNGGSDLRPTLGRTRETLFNWLRAELHNARCLDLFAGSGVLGFEALSQGAAEVTFVERDGRAVTALKDNASLLDVTQSCEIVRGDALKFLASVDSKGFDVVFLDPPFANPRLLEDALKLLAERSASDAECQPCVYAEAPARSDLANLAGKHGWQVIKSTRGGDTASVLLEPAGIAARDGQR